MITLEQIEIEGFGGFGKTFKFNLKQPGLNILNSKNGSKKTTIFSALSWVLYGKSLKPKSQIETWEDKRPKDWKGTMVNINLVSENKVTHIYRCIKYKGRIEGASGSNRLIIVEDGKEINFKDKDEAQKWIVKKLGMSFGLFKNTVVFGQKMKRFIEEDGPTKKEIFEEIFDTSYIQTAKKMAEEMRDGFQKDILSTNNELGKIDLKLEGLYKLKESLRKNLKDFEKVKLRDLKRQRAYRAGIREELSELRAHHGANMNKALERMQANLKEMESMGKKVHELDNQAFKLELGIQQDEATFEGSKKEQRRLVKELAKKHFTCSLCQQQLDLAHRKQHTRRLKQWIKDETAKQVQLLPLLEVNKQVHAKLVYRANKLKERVKGSQQLQDTIYDQKEAINKVTKLEKEKKQALKVIHEIKAQKPDTLQLRKVELEISTLENKKTPLGILLEDISQKLEDCQWVIKDPLSNSGIKAFIFSQMIKKVNSQLINYSHMMKGQIKFGIDLATGNRDFYITIQQGTFLRFYPDFSGGEQQLVNICIAFAMYDTISENNPFNLLVLDEVFEGLDDENVEIVGDLVKLKSEGKSLFVITHKRTFIPNGSNLINM